MGRYSGKRPFCGVFLRFRSGLLEGVHEPERFPHVGPVEVIAAADDLALLDLGDGTTTPIEAATVCLLAADGRAGPRPLGLPLDDHCRPAHDDVGGHNPSVRERGTPALQSCENLLPCAPARGRPEGDEL